MVAGPVVTVTSISHVSYLKIPFTPYGDKFKRRRRLMQQTLGPRSISNYHEGLQVETKRFVQSLIADPKNYIQHIRRYSGGITLSAIYGYNATSSDDRFFVLAEESMDIIANKIVGGVGLWPVDIFPFLRYLPAWAPGGGFKRKAAAWRKKIHDSMQLPYDGAKASMVCVLWRVIAPKLLRLKNRSIGGRNYSPLPLRLSS